MRRLKVVLWFYRAPGGGRAALRMLERCDLRHLAKQETGGWVYCEDHPQGGWASDGFGCVRLEESDPRLERLLGELESVGVEPTVRNETRFSKAERDTAPWLVICGGTSMVVEDEDRMSWNLDEACPQCGAGARPVGEIVLDRCRMPKTGFAVTCRKSFVVVRTPIARALERAGLGGFRVEKVRRGKRAKPDESLRWIDVQPVLPNWSKRTKTSRDRRCRECDRVGHFHSNADDRVWYKSFPAGMQDFNLTREQFGCYSRLGNGRCVGAGPGIVLSQRARQVLIDQGVRLLVSPVLLEEKKR